MSVTHWYVKETADGWDKRPVGRRVDPRYEAADYVILAAGDPRLLAIQDKEPGGKDYRPPESDMAKLTKRLEAAESEIEKLKAKP